MKLKVCDPTVDAQEALERTLSESVAQRRALAESAPRRLKALHAIQFEALPIDDVRGTMKEQRRRISSERWSTGIRHGFGRLVRSALQLRKDVRDLFSGK